MNTVYRIYTEDADRDAVVSAVSERFESFTLHETTGYFKGQPEKSIVIEIIEARERTSSSSRVRFAPSTAKRLF